MLEEIERQVAALARLANAERHRGQLNRIRGETVALLLFIQLEQRRRRVARVDVELGNVPRRYSSIGDLS